MKSIIIALLLLLGVSILQNARADDATALRHIDIAFRSLDLDKNRRLSKGEARGEEGLTAQFAHADLDSDGSLTAFEYELLHFQPEDQATLVRR